MASFPLSVSETDTTDCSSCWKKEHAVKKISITEAFLYIEKL
jgi:hypothetical protein